MKKINVVEFITSLGEGGAQSLVKDYALMLNKNAFNVTIFCIFPILDSGPGQLVKKANIKVHSAYPTYNKLFSLVNKLFGLVIVPVQLKRFLKKESIDCLHAHLAVLKYLIMIKRNLPRNVLYTCHNEPLKNFKSQKSFEFRAANSLIKNHNLQLIGLHNKMKAELNKLFGINTAVVVYNGIDIEKFKLVRESKSEIRKCIGLNDTDFVVGHVGRFSYPKNHTFILDIFDIIHRQNSNAKLLLVGTGELKNVIKDKVNELNLNDFVVFLDQRPDVNRILKSMDVFLFPSHYEGLPVSLIEAQAAGLRCIASTNVTEEAFVTPLLYPLSLKESAEKWASVIISGINYYPPYKFNLYFFDMKEDIKVLESLYLR